MNRWIVAGLMGVVAAGCGDDTTTGTGGAGGSGGATPTTTSTGDASGGGDAGGGGPGGGGTGGNGAGSCSGQGECGAEERCDFPDGLCGAGEPGTCVPFNPGCGDTGNSVTCLCSGALVGVDYTCQDDDADDTGSCDVPDDMFKCGIEFCHADQGSYCSLTSDDTGGPDLANCGQTQDPSCGDVPTCACLTAEIEACGGTCEEGEPPTVRCPGG